ncbi:MAG: signal peptidase I [Chloroflexi bacterium]|nr:signal peptidase I [Chloroflexota bacterium]
MIAGFHLFRVQGESMLPTLSHGDYVLVRDRKVSNRPPVRGDIVIATPEQRERSILKRVVGLPSERIALTEGMLLINDERLAESYLRGLPPYLGLEDHEFALGDHDYFVMGDNRAHSTDSRHYGPVRRAQIEGKVVCRVWPPLRWGIL